MKLCEIDDKYSLISYVREDIYDSYRMKMIMEDIDQGFFRPWSKYLEEAQLQPGQAEELFKKIQQQSNASGVNSTLIGKAVEKILPEKMLQKLHDSIPAPDPNAKPDPQFEQKATASIQKLNVDAQTKQGLMKVVDAGKKNPVSQAVILAVVGGVVGGLLTKAAPFITTMTGGSGTVAMAITGALVAGTVSVAAAKIQGKSWKDAFKGAIKPALAGAAGAAIGSLARDFIGNMGTATAATPAAGDTDYKVQSGDTLSQIAKDNNVSVKDLMAANPDIADPNKIMAGQDIKIPPATGNPIYQDGVGTGGPGSGGTAAGGAAAAGAATATADTPPGPPRDFVTDPNTGEMVPSDSQQAADIRSAGKGSVSNLQTSTQTDGDTTTTTTSGTLSGVTGEQIRNHPAYKAEIEKFGDNPQSRQAASMMARRAIMKGESKISKGRRLSEGQVYLLCSKIEQKNNVMLKEGYLLLEEPKKPGFLSRVGSFLKTKAQNVTQKVTADKLTRAWKEEDSPMDSEQIADFLKRQGVNDQVISDVYKEMNLPAPKGVAANAGEAGADAAGAADGGSAAAGPSAATQSKIDAAPYGYDTETGKPNPAPAGASDKTGATTPQPGNDEKTDATPAAGEAGADAAGAAAGDTAEPAAPKGPQPGQEIEMPGTNTKYKFTPQWLDDQGKPAPEAVVKVLSQLASGINKADLPLDDIRNARRSVGLVASKLNKGNALKENKIRIFRNVI
jgi:LysM repeat protein